MKLSKIFAPLTVVLMLGMATTAFADVRCTPSSPNLAAREVLNSHWANTGDILFTCEATSATATAETSVTIFFSGLPITNRVPFGGPNAVQTIFNTHAINVTNGVGNVMGFTAALDTTRVDTGTTGVNQAASLIAISLPAFTPPAGPYPVAVGTFTLNNVVLSLAGGTTNGQSVSVTLNVLLQTAGFTLAANTLKVIDVVSPALSSTLNPPALVPPIINQPANPAQFKADGTILPASVFCSTADCQNARASFAVTVTEDHFDTWRNQAQYYNNAIGVTLNPTNVLFTFAGMLPGSIISNCTVTATQTGSTTVSGLWNLTGSGIGGTAGTSTMVAEPLLPANLGVLETLTLRCGTSTSNPAYLAGASTGGASTPITVSMSMFPVGNAINTAPGTDATTGGFPRYASGTSVGPVTVVNFVGAVTGQTTMLIPWVTASGAAAPPAGTFNTGVAIANTTKDPVPFGTDFQGGAVDSAGNVSFHFFPGDLSASFSVTPTTGFGLQSGVIPAGGTFIGNFSDILKAGGQSGTFSGYVFAITGFSHAHGVAFVYGGGASDRITSATDVLVIGNPAIQPRNTVSVTPDAELTTK